MNQRLLLTLTAFLAMGAGLVFNRLYLADTPEPDAGSATAGPVGAQRPPFTLGRVDGRKVSSSEFDGRVMLINFWATWCGPCRTEMPMLVKLQTQYAGRGLAVVGIALDDVGQARAFAKSLGVNYTVLVGGADVIAVSRAYGNLAGQLPYSVLVDRHGVVRWTHLGELSRDTLEKQLEKLL